MVVMMVMMMRSLLGSAIGAARVIVLMVELQPRAQRLDAGFGTSAAIATFGLDRR